MSHAATHIVRALGNPTSSSAAPSATAGGGDQGSGPDPYGSLLQGHPPIIIAFLGVGAFIAVLLMLYGYRRVTQGRRLGLYPGPGGLRGRGGGVPMVRGPGMAKDIGERPLFWDFSTSRSTEKEAEKVYWKDLLPISTNTTCKTHGSETKRPTKPLSPSPTVAQAILRSNFRETFRSQLSTRQAGNPENSESSTSPCEVTMQVVVAIAMPCRHSAACRESDSEEMLEYSLGVVEIPWHEARSLS